MARLLPVAFYSDTVVDQQELYTFSLMAYSDKAFAEADSITKAGIHDSCRDWGLNRLYTCSRGARIVLYVGGWSKVAHEEKYYSLLGDVPTQNG